MKIIYIFSILFLSVSLKSQTNIKDGNYVLYYPDGSIKAKGNYLNSNKVGEWNHYHQNGNVALTKNYVHGKQIGVWKYFNENGHLTMKINDISKIDESVELSHFIGGKLKVTSTFVKGKKETNPSSILNRKF